MASHGRFGNGTYREVLISNRALSAPEIDRVEARVTSKRKLSKCKLSCSTPRRRRSGPSPFS